MRMVIALLLLCVAPVYAQQEQAACSSTTLPRGWVRVHLRVPSIVESKKYQDWYFTLYSPEGGQLELEADYRQCPADMNGNGVIDRLDLGLFLGCYSGPTIPHVNAPGCYAADFDLDGDVDQDDFGLWQQAWTGGLRMSFPTGWSKRWDAAIPAAQVGTGGVSNFSVLLILPTSVYTYANADGSDLRASADTAGASELALDLIYWNPAGSAPIVRVGLVTLSDSVANNISIWAGNSSATKPAATDPNGSYAVYDSGWGGYWPLQESAAGGANCFKDRTVNQNHGSPSANHDAADLITGKVGDAQNFDGQLADSISINGAAGTYSPSSWSMFLWTRRSATTRQFPISYGSGSSDAPVAAIDMFDGSTTQSLVRDNASSTGSVTGGGANASGSWNHWVLTNESASSHKFYKDGSQVGSTNTTTLSTTTVTKLTIGQLNRTTAAFALDGDVDEVHVHTVGRSAAWVKTEFNQTNDNASFATWSGPTDVGGGTAYSFTIEDGVGITDTVSRVVSAGRAIDEAVGVGDDLARAAVAGRTVADGVGLADTVVRACAQWRTQTDGVVLTDVVQRVATAARTIAEHVAVTDATVRVATLERVIEDALALVDSAFVAAPEGQAAIVASVTIQLVARGVVSMKVIEEVQAVIRMVARGQVQMEGL